MAYIRLDDASYIDPGPFKRAQLLEFLKALSRQLRVRLLLTINCVDNPTSQALNQRYRQQNKATNILSFPYESEGKDLIGELVIAHEVLYAEAEALHISPEQHYAHLLVHGILHLLGHDHEEDAEAHIMEALETQCLIALGYDHPYPHGSV